jgi:hypothetical protein
MFEEERWYGEERLSYEIYQRETALHVPGTDREQEKVEAHKFF